MKKLKIIQALLVFSLLITTISPLLVVAETSENNEVSQATDIVTRADLGNQDWLINEVNKQLAPKTIGVDTTFEDLDKIVRIRITTNGNNNPPIVGQIPEEIVKLKNLARLELFSNELTGKIPQAFSQMPKLDYLRIDYNQMTGTIPEGLGNISYINFTNNKFVGQLPKSLYENRTGENEVNISGNQVTINNMLEIPKSIYNVATFLYTGGYDGHIETKNNYFNNLKSTDVFTPFLVGSPTFLDLFVSQSFDRELFPEHVLTIEDTSLGKIIYEGEINSNLSFPLEQWESGSHLLKFTLDEAFNNPNNSTFVTLDIAATEIVNVRYLDEQDNEIHEANLIKGYSGEAYDATTPEYKLDIPTYKLDETQLPLNAIGTIGSQYQEVIYRYEKLEGAPVKVNYQDEEGNELAPAEILTGKLGVSYSANEKSIKDWLLKIKPENEIGVFTDQPQIVTYIYEKVEGAPVKVNYQDKEGNELAPTEILTGKIGTPYSVKEKPIKDWLLKIEPENAKGTFTDQPQTVTYVYEKVEGAPITVNYQDEEGNELAPTEILTGKLGTPYSVKEKTIKYWTLKIEPENAKGTFTDQPQTVTYVYEKVEGAPITVKYQDEEGNELETSEILTGRVGTAYNTNKKNIKGWTLKSEPKNATGAFTEEPQTVAYIYEKEKLSTNEILPSPTNKPNVNNPLFIHSITEHSGIFPKTGEEKNYSLIIGILIFISFIVTVDKKKYLGNKD